MATPPSSSGERLKSATNLVSEFPSGNTEEGLERIRKRLLDLTNRNPLLNYRHPKRSCIRVVNVSMDHVFRGLLEENKLSIEPVPGRRRKNISDTLDSNIPQQSFQLNSDSVQDGTREKADRDQFRQHDVIEDAKQAGWNPSYELEEVPGKAGPLCVLQYRDELDRSIRLIDSKARTIIEESGANMLYLAFGFLEWYESEDSDEAHLAPLLMVPVRLERTRGPRLGTVEYTGDHLECNPCLAELLSRDFALEIPSYAEEDDVQNYLGKFGSILDAKPRWSVRHFLTLSFLSFTKILMYRDLDPARWPDGSLAQHPRVRELFEGTRQSEAEYGQEYMIDAPEMKGRVPKLILDADSSQHSALIDAVEGKNLVIEGPPGTGKSQTIANLIAHAIATGKTVLFAAEKLAALEVVRKRLDDVGLGHFCLELHSHRTQKQGLMRDLEDRLRLLGKFAEPPEIEAATTLLAEKRHRLIQYAKLINSTWTPLGKTIFDILWARQRARRVLRELPVPEALDLSIRLSFAPKATREDLARAEQFIAIYAKHLKAITAGGTAVKDHPWAWVRGPVPGFKEESRLLHLVRSLNDPISDVRETISWLFKSPGIEVTSRLDFRSRAEDALQLLPFKEEVPDAGLLSRCRLSENRKALQRIIGCIEHARPIIAKIEQRLSAPFQWDHDLTSELLRRSKDVQGLGMGKLNLMGIRGKLKHLNQLLDYINEARAWSAKLSGLLQVPVAETLPSLRLAFDCVDLIRSAPVPHLHLRGQGTCDEAAPHVIRPASEESSLLRAQRSRLSTSFDLTLSPAPDILLANSNVLEWTGLWGRIFSRDYRAAKHEYMRIARRRRRRLVMATDLRQLASHLKQLSAFSSRADLKSRLGSIFQGINTDWNGLLAITDWWEGIERVLPSADGNAQPFRRFLLTVPTDQLMRISRDIRLRDEDLKKSRQVVGEVQQLVQGTESLPRELSSEPLAELSQHVSSISATLRDCLATCENALLQQSASIMEVIELADDAQKVLDLKDAMEGNEVGRATLGSTYEGLGTELGPVKETLGIAESVDSGKFSQRLVEWLLCDAYRDRLHQLKSKLGQLANSTLPEICNEICALAGTKPENIWPSLDLDEVARHAVSLCHLEEELAGWIHYLRLGADAEAVGVNEITELADIGKVSVEDLLPIFRYAFFDSLSQTAFQQYPELSASTGLTLEEIQRQFASLDRELIDLNRHHYAARADRAAPRGNHIGPVGTWTDMALIRHEIDKQKRHIPIRKLIERAGFALQCLKPCFMMGPLSVAQYLAPGKLTFDLIVMDEASQLKPEDAIGVVARGGQLVVVGDPKQLPPTDFFQRLDVEDGDDLSDDDRAAVEEGESILDVAMGIYQPARRLRWHYRSRHESLIAFSNNEFYQGDLIVFPTPFPKKDDLGVRWHEIPHPVYENRRNIPEAQAVVDAVIDHMHRSVDESLGVVALNIQQRELVEELFEKALTEDLQVQAYQDKFSAGLEGFFVKNLENVQGDERDVIFISCTYGPDRRGNQFQRFGPINSENGWRRLNVLFTRAKKRVEVFSSLDPAKIQIQPGMRRGVRALKEYLEYAKTGAVRSANPGAREPESDFEVSVAGVLADKGFQVQPQVGVAGFFIDLAVVHPYEPGVYLTGIECDGAAYHSARSARDRDRLRQEILQNLGWKIYRIWSTDWFRARESETKRLLSYIESLVSQDPKVSARRAVQNKATALRQRLLEFREKTIRAEFPDTEPARCLLRDAMIEELVRCRPSTSDEWFRRIPLDLRAGTDSAQVARFVGDVLTIVRDHI
jgi:very-short-patch-repair endonuclease